MNDGIDQMPWVKLLQVRWEIEHKETVELTNTRLARV